MGRRHFLKALGAVAATPWVVPASVLGRNGTVPPSERIAIGIIGTGNQGTAHTRVLVGIPEAQIVAVCDPVRDKRQKLRQIVENWAQGTADKPSRDGAEFNDFRDLLARADVDAVFIASPEHWHALHTIAAARAGKDIYCEKAMAKTIAESQAMVKAVRQHQRVFQLGTQQRSSANRFFDCRHRRGSRGIAPLGDCGRRRLAHHFSSRRIHTQLRTRPVQREHRRQALFPGNQRR